MKAERSLLHRPLLIADVSMISVPAPSPEEVTQYDLVQKRLPPEDA